LDSTVDLLRKAIQTARSGRDLTARALFQDVVSLDPANEVAWIWLTGLLDTNEERIAACERVLGINPGNTAVRSYYKQLLAEQNALRNRALAELDEVLTYARACYEKKDHKQALMLVQDILRREKSHTGAWMLFAELASGLEEKVRAYQAVLDADPSHLAAREALARLRKFQNDPFDQAAYFEEEGKYDEAIAIYEELASRAGGSPDFDRAYREITRLEDIKIEKIRRVPLAVNIGRMSIGLPLLYLLLALMQEGLNPIRNFSPQLWLGLPFVAAGSILIAVIAHWRHTFWQRWIRKGSQAMAARLILGLAGWMMVFIPLALLVIDSLARLSSFKIPPIPFIP